MKLPIDGREAYAHTGGKTFDPGLPCIVFVHGAVCDHSVWTALASWFADHGHSVLAVDLPGHQLSTGAPLASVEALGDWLLALLDAAGVRQAALVGHSMGSVIVLEAAARAPERVTHLVMAGTAFPLTVAPALLDAARETPHKAIEMISAYSFAAVSPAAPDAASVLRLQSQQSELMQQVQASQQALNLIQHDLSMCSSYAGAMTAAARVSCPVTLVLGEQDRMTRPKAAAELAAALKARVVTLPTGHSLMAEAPDAMLAALRQALA